MWHSQAAVLFAALVKFFWGLALCAFFCSKSRSFGSFFLSFCLSHCLQTLQLQRDLSSLCRWGRPIASVGFPEVHVRGLLGPRFLAFSPPSRLPLFLGPCPLRASRGNPGAASAIPRASRRPTRVLSLSHLVLRSFHRDRLFHLRHFQEHLVRCFHSFLCPCLSSPRRSRVLAPTEDAFGIGLVGLSVFSRLLHQTRVAAPSLSSLSLSSLSLRSLSPLSFSLSLFLCPSFPLSPSLSLSFPLFPSLPLSLSPPLCLSLTLSLTHIQRRKTSKSSRTEPLLRAQTTGVVSWDTLPGE